MSWNQSVTNLSEDFVKRLKEVITHLIKKQNNYSTKVYEEKLQFTYYITMVKNYFKNSMVKDGKNIWKTYNTKKYHQGDLFCWEGFLILKNS